MSITQCPSGRRRWPALEAIQTSKRFLAGQEAAACRYGCGGYHLEPVKTAAGETKPPKPARDTGPDRKTRGLVLARDGFMCVAERLSVYARARVEPQPNGCWYWTGSIRKEGYGVANLPGGKRDGAHRLVYMQIVGPIPDGLTLDHQCHNRDHGCPGGNSCLHRRCVNPDHLEPATFGDNARRGKTPPALNLAKETCSEGHPFDRMDPRGWRKCSICDLARQEAKRRAAGIPERKLWQSHCPHGHEYTPENTRWSKGNRYCKACDAARVPIESERKRKPCQMCGGPKDPGNAFRYCETCRKLRASMPRKKKRRNTGPSAQVRKIVLERDGYACVCCGRPVTGQQADIQHRVSRGMGGTSSPAANSPVNLLLMLRECHQRVESRIDPEDNARGYWLRMGEDPALTGVMYFEQSGAGFTAWLCEDGSLVFEAPAGAA